MRLNISSTLLRAATLQDLAKQIDIGVQRQIGTNLTYVPVLSDPNTAIVLADFKGINEIDTTAPYYANGQLQNVSPNGTGSAPTPQGIILTDPAGKQLSLICRGRNVTEQAIDCAQKASLYMIDPVAQHTNGTSLVRRDDDGQKLIEIITGALGGAITVVAGVGWGIWKVHASKKKARKAVEATNAELTMTTNGEYNLQYTIRQGDRAPSPLATEAEDSLDATIMKWADARLKDSLAVADSGLSVFEDWSMSSKTPSEASSIMQKHIGDDLLERGVGSGLEAGRSTDGTILGPLAENLRQTKSAMEADPRIGSFSSPQHPNQHEEVRLNRFERVPRVEVPKKIRGPQQPVAKPQAPATQGSRIDDVMNGHYGPGDQKPKEPPPPVHEPPTVEDAPSVNDIFGNDPTGDLPPPEPHKPGTGHRDPHRPGGEGGRERPEPLHEPPHIEPHHGPKIPKFHPPKMRRVSRGHL